MLGREQQITKIRMGNCDRTDTASASS